MNADLSPALAASNTVETLAPQTVQEIIISQEIFKPEALAVLVEQGAVQPEITPEAESQSIGEIALAPESVAALDGSAAVTPETGVVPAEEIAEIVLAAPRVVEKIIHPEVGVTREKIDHKILTSHIKNPA